MKRIGVVGAGVMGTGVAQDLGQRGFEVTLVDVGTDVLDRAKEEIEKGARMSALLGNAPGKLDPEAITYTTDYGDLSGAEYVVENTTEKWEIKRDLYPVLDRVCDPGVVFAANTSAVPITKIASRTSRPESVVGIHFMNPVPMKPTVEVIRGWHTSEQTLATTTEFLDGMAKQGVVVEDAPGFVSNRVLMLTVNEAVFLVHDRVATAEQVDQVFRECFGHPMGPLETADLIGLDTILYSVEVLQQEFDDDKYRPCPLLKKMVDAGLHGRKSGQGFHTYN